MSDPVPKLPVQLVQHIAGHRHVTTFQPDIAIASMRIRGFALMGFADGVPIFRGVGKPQVEQVLVYEKPAT